MLKKKVCLVLAAATIAVGMSGCVTVQSPALGVIYTDVKHGDVATSARAGSKKGEACAQSILGLVAQGDASIEAAKAAGGISEVTQVDHSSWSVLGIIGKYCTIVKGS